MITKLTLESIFPPKDETITITRYLTRRERILRGKDKLVSMILMNFNRGDTIRFSFHRARFRVHFSDSEMCVHQDHKLTQYMKQYLFKTFLLSFDIITLMRISKMLSKNHLDMHAQNKQKLKFQVINSTCHAGIEEFI